jgi:broad specificity phosphatase PhoE
MKTDRHKNYEWELSEYGFKQAQILGKLFHRLYKNKKEVPLIYVSPFKRTIQTAIPIARALNTTIRLENGLFEHGHGTWNSSQINGFFKHEKQIFEKYYSKFHITYEMSHPPRQSEKEIKIFHSEVAGYFQNRALELGKDLIIVTHQDVVYNLAKEIASNDMI